MSQPIDQELLDKLERNVAKFRENVDAIAIGTKMQCFFLDEEYKGKPVFLTKEQIKCGEILLKKVVPDVKTVEVTGANGGPVQVIINDPTRRQSTE